MKESSYLFYSSYLKNKSLKNKNILVSKINKSYLIGPIINDEFDEKSFYKRVLSNSIFTKNKYKKITRKQAIYLINKYKKYLSSNEVLEVFKNGEFILHKIIYVPEDMYEK